MKILWLGLETRLNDRYTEQEHQYLILNRDTFSMEKLEKFKPDIVIEREFNDFRSIYKDEMIFITKHYPKIKRAVWLIDTHVQFARHLKYAEYFDYIFLAISRFVPIIKGVYKSKKVYWLPLGHPVASLPPNQMEKRSHKVSFVGRWGQTLFKERTYLVEKLKQESYFYAVTDYSNCYKIMSDSEISFNRSYSEDLNFRIFEALACGSEVVTNLVPDLLNIEGLEDQIHIYKHDEEALPMIRELASGKRRFKGTPESHRKWVGSKHLLVHRVSDCIKMIQNDTQIDY